jgi:cell division protein FtsI/penicillin-binding protein 2
VIETIFVRLRLILIGLALFCGLIVLQLLRIDFASSNVVYFRDLADTISQRPREFAPARGRIYDREGELLATNDIQYELGLSPPNVANAKDVATTLSDLLDKSVTDLLAAAQSDKPYVLIERPVSAEVGEKIKALQASGDVNLSGVDLSPIPHRYYPGGPLASQVLGFVAYNTEGRLVGYFGVEGFYNDILSGRSVKGIERMVPFDVQPDPTPDEGADLHLTLDRDIQYLVEVTMADAMTRYAAVGGTIIVMDPKTGAILGMSSWPTFDPNNYLKYPPTDPENPAISGQYEPGSTFKILTVAAALDSGVTTPQTIYVDTGFLEVGGVAVRNWDGGSYGPVDMVGCLRYSLNTCMSDLAVKLGPTTFYNYLSAFGFGHLSNVDMAAEAAGRLKRPGDSDWFDSDLGTNAFGQGVAVTPLQLITAVSAIANGGTMMQPHILQQVQHGGKTHIVQPQVLGRPIKPETAALLSEMLAQSMELGEADQALVSGYRLAGKTGTAQIPIVGGYDPERTVASFVGWGPVDDPRFVALVILDRPAASIWGAETAAPVFAELVKRLVVLLEIPPDEVRLSLAANSR